MGNWHDSTQGSSQEAPTATVRFLVTSVAVHGIIDNSRDEPTDLKFFIDGLAGQPYFHQNGNTSAGPEYIYNVQLFSADSLSPNQHTLVIQNGDTQTSSFMILDFVEYTPLPSTFTSIESSTSAEQGSSTETSSSNIIITGSPKDSPTPNPTSVNSRIQTASTTFSQSTSAAASTHHAQKSKSHTILLIGLVIGVLSTIGCTSFIVFFIWGRHKSRVLEDSNLIPTMNPLLSTGTDPVVDRKQRSVEGTATIETTSHPATLTSDEIRLVRQVLIQGVNSDAMLTRGELPVYS
ncbi:hypothetical protein C8J56DRAFT_1169324 [Mycena floridula]|nr:hypothetical protein C8J56DRAFT_1169324 [Mycena floridula]